MQNQIIEYKKETSEIDLLDSFLCDCKVRNFAPGTIGNYKSHVKYFLSFYSINASINDLKDFLMLLRDEKGFSSSTIGNYFYALSTFYDFLVWENVVNENIIPKFQKRFIRYYKEERPEERQLINKEQMKALINSVSDIRFKTMFLFFAKTGIRRQELIDLDLENVFLSKNYAVLKPHAKRSNNIAFFDEECKQMLEKYIKWHHNHKVKTKALFIGIQGDRINRDTIYDITTRQAKKLGFHKSNGSLDEKFTPHCFRHFFTTWMRRQGCPRAALQELRGDNRKDAIDIYDHWTKDELREVYLEYIYKFDIT